MNNIYLVFSSLKMQKRIVQTKVYHRFFHSVCKEKTHKPSNAVAAKNLFSIVYVINTTYFDEFFLFHAITGRFKSSRPEVLLGKSFLKICSKFTGEYLCRSVISIKFLRHWGFHKNLLHIFRTTFPTNTYGGLFLMTFICIVSHSLA